METKYWIFPILLCSKSSFTNTAKQKNKSTWCQVYRNIKPNQAKFCELMLDVNTEKITDFDLNY